jgi:hypothetical protein
MVRPCFSGLAPQLAGPTSRSLYQPCLPGRSGRRLSIAAAPPSGWVARVLELDDFCIDGSRRWLRDRRGAFGYLLGTLPASRRSAASVITRLDQAGLVGEDDGLGPVAKAELGKQVGEVGLHRRFTEEQRAGDLLV